MDEATAVDEAPDPGPVRGIRRRRVVTTLLVFLAIFLAAAVASVAFVANLGWTFDAKSPKIEHAFPQESLRPPKATEGPAATAMNILLLGSDSRGDSVDLAENGIPSNQRSDSMMLVHVPADRNGVIVMSIMRDTWVDIPGFGEAKINAAMAFGGVPLVVQTIEGMFGTRIDHVAVADFAGFKDLTDAMGGVRVDVPIAFTSTPHPTSLNFNAGLQTMNGDQALAFARERYAFADGDFQRVKDQRILLHALMDKALTAETLANPLRIQQMVATMAPFVSVDKGLDSGTLGSLLLGIKGLGSNVTSFTLPTAGTGTSTDGQSIVVRDDAAIEGIAAALKTDQLGAFLAGANIPADK